MDRTGHCGISVSAANQYGGSLRRSTFRDTVVTVLSPVHRNGARSIGSVITSTRPSQHWTTSATISSPHLLTLFRGYPGLKPVLSVSEDEKLNLFSLLRPRSRETIVSWLVAWTVDRHSSEIATAALYPQILVCHSLSVVARNRFPTNYRS